jgi:hypothetical protein
MHSREKTNRGRFIVYELSLVLFILETALSLSLSHIIISRAMLVFINYLLLLIHLKLIVLYPFIIQ